MRVLLATFSATAAFQTRDGVKNMLRRALVQEGVDVHESTNDACQVAGHYHEAGNAYYLRQADLAQIGLENFGGDSAYTGIKVPDTRAKLLNEIVSEAFPEFQGEFLSACQNVVPAGYTPMTQPCPGAEGGPVVQMSGLDTITKCKDAFMNKADNSLAWFSNGQCFIGNEKANRDWFADACHLDSEVEGMGSMPEWSLTRDEVFNPVE